MLEARHSPPVFGSMTLSVCLSLEAERGSVEQRRGRSEALLLLVPRFAKAELYLCTGMHKCVSRTLKQ